MIVTAELSLYPLVKDYEKVIIDFIRILRESESVEVWTHSMSTFVKGDSASVFDTIHAALLYINASSETLSLVIKIINRNIPVEQGFITLD